jgi:hypothetical protein
MKKKTNRDVHGYECKECKVAGYKIRGKEKVKCECGLEVGTFYLRMHKLLPIHAKKLSNLQVDKIFT